MYHRRSDGRPQRQTRSGRVQSQEIRAAGRAHIFLDSATEASEAFRRSVAVASEISLRLDKAHNEIIRKWTGRCLPTIEKEMVQTSPNQFPYDFIGSPIKS